MLKIYFLFDDYMDKTDQRELIKFLQAQEGIVNVAKVSSSSKVEQVSRTCYASLSPLLTEAEVIQMRNTLDSIYGIRTLFVGK